VSIQLSLKRVTQRQTTILALVERVGKLKDGNWKIAIEARTALGRLVKRQAKTN
jgi:hypothetical protein